MLFAVVLAHALDGEARIFAAFAMPFATDCQLNA
jgi:hypothetical protein